MKNPSGKNNHPLILAELLHGEGGGEKKKPPVKKNTYPPSLIFFQ
jgi:hypothetical protein